MTSKMRATEGKGLNTGMPKDFPRIVEAFVLKLTDAPLNGVLVINDDEDNIHYVGIDESTADELIQKLQAFLDGADVEQ